MTDGDGWVKLSAGNLASLLTKIVCVSYCKHYFKLDSISCQLNLISLRMFKSLGIKLKLKQ